MITFDSKGFIINGERKILHSADFHYFRVPKKEWKSRLLAFCETGGNCIATYVPWLIHEPTEGDIRFGDCDSRDLAAFLELAKELKLPVILRPGPYQYSELTCAGLPQWLHRDYPQVLARKINGEIIGRDSVSYIHPLFLQKAERYLTAVIDVVRPFMAENGGTVSMIQLDNEIPGIQIWNGSIDYNAESMGFGNPDGRYSRYLAAKYKTIEAVNEAYGDNCTCICQIKPSEFLGNEVQTARKKDDYYNFYLETCAEYGEILRSIYEKNGINCSFIHNAAHSRELPLLTRFCKRQNGKFLLGIDHYNNLGYPTSQNNFTPQLYIYEMIGADLLKSLGMPPTVIEMQGGSPADLPPVLKEDMLTTYMAHASLGFKGYNYYVFTGGPNMPGTYFVSDIYDYNAFIHADGTFNTTYEALKEFGLFLKDHSWLANAERETRFQIGIQRDYWQKIPELKSLNSEYLKATQSTDYGIVMSMLYSGYSGRFCELTDPLDRSIPLVTVTSALMSQAAQKNIADFISGGGQALIFGKLPELDETLALCSVLRDCIGVTRYEEINDVTNEQNVDGMRVFSFDMSPSCCIKDEVTDSVVIAKAAGRVVGIEKNIGKGRVLYLCNTYTTKTLRAVEMFEKLVDRLGVKPTAVSSNRHIFTQVLSDGTNRALFVLNLYTGKLKTEITVFGNDAQEETFGLELAPTEVRYIPLKPTTTV